MVALIEDKIAKHVICCYNAVLSDFQGKFHMTGTSDPLPDS